MRALTICHEGNRGSRLHAITAQALGFVHCTLGSHITLHYFSTTFYSELEFELWGLYESILCELT